MLTSLFVFFSTNDLMKEKVKIVSISVLFIKKKKDFYNSQRSHFCGHSSNNKTTFSNVRLYILYVTLSNEKKKKNKLNNKQDQINMYSYSTTLGGRIISLFEYNKISKKLMIAQY